MKKLFFISFFLGLYASLNATPPLDRYGGRYEVTPDTITGVHYKFYNEPNINDFEYRTIMEDIYAIWRSTSISECARYKAVNVLLELRLDPYITYSAGIYRSTIPFNINSLNVCTEGQEFYWNPNSYAVEAEEANFILSPMKIAFSTMASAGYYVYSPEVGSGSVSFVVNIESGSYILWARVLSVDGSHDSFYVSIDDNQEDIFDTSDNHWRPEWQWTAVNGRQGTAIPKTWDPRIFTLSKGKHKFTFRAREAGTGLDKIYITKDILFIP